jgi:hypothetical protein
VYRIKLFLKALIDGEEKLNKFFAVKFVFNFEKRDKTGFSQYIIKKMSVLFSVYF